MNTGPKRNRDDSEPSSRRSPKGGVQQSFIKLCADGDLHTLKQYFVDNPEAIQQLEKTYSPINAQTHEILEGFREAVVKNNLEVVEYFLSIPEIRSKINHVGNWPLRLAFLHNRLRSADRLLRDKGVEDSCTIPFILTNLSWAADNGRIGVFLRLLELPVAKEALVTKGLHLFEKSKLDVMYDFISMYSEQHSTRGIKLKEALDELTDEFIVKQLLLSLDVGMDAKADDLLIALEKLNFNENDALPPLDLNDANEDQFDKDNDDDQVEEVKRPGLKLHGVGKARADNVRAQLRTTLNASRITNSTSIGIGKKVLLDKLYGMLEEKTSELFTINEFQREFEIYDLPPEVDRRLYESFELRNMATNWRYSQANSEQKLCYAARWNVLPMIDSILRAEPDLIRGSLALATACLCSQEEAAMKLVNEYGADVNQAPKNAHKSPLCAAVWAGKTSLVRFLIGRGAVVNSSKGTFFNMTPLQECLFNMKDTLTGKIDSKYIPIFKLLLEHGADPTVNMPLYNISLQEYLQRLQGDPELIREAKEILAQANPSIQELTELMQGHGLDPNELDLLICSIGSMTLDDQEPGKKHRATK